MTIKTFYFNPYRECTYVVWDEQNRSGKALIIDAGMHSVSEQQRFIDYMQQQQLTPLTLLITHTHPDHICGLEFLRTTYQLTPTIFPPEGLLTIPGFDGISVIHTPGHKADCVCYYWATQRCIFTGDTLFKESVGRTDLPEGDISALFHSLNQLTCLPDDVVIYPGHGYASTIGYEKQHNPYL